MYPEIIIGNSEMEIYTWLFLLAYIVMGYVVRGAAEKRGIPGWEISQMYIWCLVGIFVGAKVLYAVTRLPDIIGSWDFYGHLLENDFKAFIRELFGGMVFYGGLGGAVATAVIYCKIKKMPVGRIANIFAPVIPFMHGVGRIGCFMSGCCYGVEYHGFGSVRFPYNEGIPELSEVPRFPVQLLSAAANFVIAFVLLRLLKRNKNKDGQLLGIYLSAYAVVRFLLEYLRGDQIRGMVGPVSVSQFISIIIFPAGLILAIRGIRSDND